MSNALLDRLKPDALFSSLGPLPPPAVLRRALQRVPDVARVAWALRRGQITEQMVREFAATATADWQRGQQLPCDVTLAALAVALEPCGQEFADEFLCDLARLKLAEMGTSIRVARECLKARYVLPKNEVRRFKFPLSFRVRSPLPLTARRAALWSDRPKKATELKYPVAVGEK